MAESDNKESIVKKIFKNIAMFVVAVIMIIAALGVWAQDLSSGFKFINGIFKYKNFENNVKGREISCPIEDGALVKILYGKDNSYTYSVVGGGLEMSLYGEYEIKTDDGEKSVSVVRINNAEKRTLGEVEKLDINQADFEQTVNYFDDSKVDIINKGKK